MKYKKEINIVDGLYEFHRWWGRHDRKTTDANGGNRGGREQTNGKKKKQATT